MQDQGFIQREGGAPWDFPPPPRILKNYDVIALKRKENGSDFAHK